MEETIVGMLSSNDLHVVLVGVIIMLAVALAILWRKFNEMLGKMLEVRAIVTSVHALNMQQSDELRDIKRQTNGH